MKFYLLMIWLCAGCVDHELCAGHDGTCLGLRVTGGGQVDQLRVQVDGITQLDGRTPAAPGPARALPVTTALFLAPVTGAVTLSVTGFLDGAEVGRAGASAAIRPGLHANLEVALSTPTDLPIVLADLAQPDLAGADLGGDDLAVVDAASPSADLAHADLAGTGPRRVFLLPAHSAQLGTLAGLDQSCNDAAQAASLGGSFFALIAYPGVDPRLRYSIHPGRQVVLPSGTAVATDDTFFTITHLHGIDELADATAVNGCAWTWFDPNGYALSTSTNCAGWTSVAMTNSGAYGDVTASDVGWCISNVATCDAMPCHVYCAEN